MIVSVGGNKNNFRPSSFLLFGVHHAGPNDPSPANCDDIVFIEGDTKLYSLTERVNRVHDYLGREK